MRLTPLALRRARFSAAVRGFNRAEVSSFLEEAAADFEQAVRQAERARQEVGSLQAQLEEHHQREATLRETLSTAQRVSSEVRETAKREAELIVREARDQARDVMRADRTACQRDEREAADLHHRRREAEQSLEDAIASLRTALDIVRRQDQEGSPPTNLRPHQPRPTLAAQGPTRMPDHPAAAVAPGSSS